MEDPNKQTALGVLCAILTLTIVCICMISNQTIEDTNLNENKITYKDSYVYAPSYFIEAKEIGGVVEDQAQLDEIELPEWSISYPIEITRQTQGFTGYHRGIDIVNDSGNNIVRSIEAGEIIYVGWKEKYGNRVEVDHMNGFISTYSHLSKMGVELGEQVVNGNKIGMMGNTGKSTGRHLHFEILYNGIKVDPNIYLK